MIARMSKYAFLVYHKEYETFLVKLRDLGVVHVKNNKSTKDNEVFQEILGLRKEIDDVQKIFRNLNTREGGEEPVQLADARPIDRDGCRDILKSVSDLQEKRVQLQHKISALDKDISYLELIWGEFDYTTLNKLKDAGYNVSFYSCPTSEFDPIWEELYNAVLIKTIQPNTFFITISNKGKSANVFAEQIRMPEYDLATLRAKKEQLSAEVEQLDETLNKSAAENYNSLVKLDKELQDEFNYSNVLIQTKSEADDKLMLLEGWVPEVKASEMEASLDTGGYFFRKLEIEAGDSVPVQLLNNKFAKLYEPICKMFSLPNYGEFDPTPFFAPFFMLFFGICFADGGYGLLMMIICTILKGKVGPDFKPVCTLFQFLGAATLFVGIVTGTFFGVVLVDFPMFAGVKDYFISSDNMMPISLVIGVIHILFGKSVAALKVMSQKGTKFGIAPFAWVFTITALLLAFGLPSFDIQLSKIVVNVLYGVVGVSLTVALLYNSPGKNIFMNFGSGLWTLYNIASGMLGDTLSYIRLFAIGLTGAILGSVFNNLALTMTEGLGIVPRVIFMTIILLFGHGLNFGLCIISSLIHPLRLVFVEYYKNAEFEGGGKAYQPFKKI